MGRVVTTLALAATLFGCRSRLREPSPRPGVWTTVEPGARDAAAARDATPGDLGSRDSAPEAGQRDAAADGSGATRDGGSRDTASHDLSARDAGGRDLGVRDGGQDLRARDATVADSGFVFCGSLRISCAPYACDVDAGRCKSFCASDDDCVSGEPCLNGLCNPNTNSLCHVDDECFSGHCASGVCCSTSCSGPCRSCAVPGTLGVCFPVPAGAPDPQHLCPSGTVCGADAGCVPAPDAAASL